MRYSRSWAILAAAPALSVAALFLTTNDRIRWLFRCNYGLPHLMGYATVGACIFALFALAATLTFATEAAGNDDFHPLARAAWAFALIGASPLTLPLYWALYLRCRS